MNQSLHSKLIVAILAAGKGVRMQSDTPKVLHPIAKRPMLGHILKTAQALNPQKIIVIHPKKELSERIFDFVRQFAQEDSIENIEFAEQSEQLGTGDAVAKALKLCDSQDDARLLILYGDTPLIQASTLARFIESTPPDALGLITARLDNPTGLGRILRDANQKIEGIVEEKDATAQQRAIQETNSGLYLVPLSFLKQALPLLKNNNASKEYYLTDIVAFAVEKGMQVLSQPPEFIEEVLGVNDRVQQSNLERCYQKKLAHTYLKQGVFIADPNRFDVRGTLLAQSGVTIDLNVLLEGKIILGHNTSIGPNCILINCEIGDDVEILANSYLENVKISKGCTVGPFARLRPGTYLEEGAKIGNFVEVKASTIGVKSKVNHLSYIGDATVGANVNVGAGTITCNYDGVNKHKTIIEDNVRIGADTQLIAPIRVGEGATIGAGSTVVKDVAANKLTLTHQLQQRTKDDWKQSS